MAISFYMLVQVLSATAMDFHTSVNLGVPVDLEKITMELVEIVPYRSCANQKRLLQITLCQEVLPIHFLVECATGYALFLAHGINDIDRIRYQAAEEYINRSDTPFELKDYLSFSSVDADPLLQMNAIFESNVTDELREFLKKNFEPPFRRHVLATADPIFGVNIVMKLGLCHRYETLINHVMRGLREKIHEFIGLPHADLDKAQQDLVRRYNEQMRTKLDTESPVPKPGSRVIYVGNVCGLTVSDLSDLVGSHNIEAGFILSHAHFYLKAGGHYMICTKANDMNSTGNAIFAYGDRQRQFKLIQTVMLDLVKGTYALDIGGYKMPVE
ncbi:hypothetical protein TSUD_158970 [Trifolium subterraneum]|uniref:Uncharacterized protein n=1 Tax=Trifolium subterraneum TaxID=3900 RepID=A0A2Z6N6N7_TRISU|nr:hypothetical protein TSUD_158970 [Trifolium subterraneum]